MHNSNESAPSSDTLRFIYSLLPLIYRVQFARVCHLWHNAAPKDMRDIHAIILARLPHPYLSEVFTCGGYIAGDFLLDCLHDTNYYRFIDIVFDIGTEHQAYCYFPAPQGILEEEQRNPALSKFNQFIKGILARPDGFAIANTTQKIRRIDSPYAEVNCRTIYTDTEVVGRLLITNPGTHNYMSIRYLPFLRTMYNGKALTADDLMGIIRKSITVGNTTFSRTYEDVDDNNQITGRATQEITLPDSFVLHQCERRGFTVNVIV